MNVELYSGNTKCASYSGRKPSNQIKNRYSDVLCLDHSRVRLCTLNNEDDEVGVISFFVCFLLYISLDIVKLIN